MCGTAPAAHPDVLGALIVLGDYQVWVGVRVAVSTAAAAGAGMAGVVAGMLGCGVYVLGRAHCVAAAAAVGFLVNSTCSCVARVVATMCMAMSTTTTAAGAAAAHAAVASVAGIRAYTAIRADLDAPLRAQTGVAITNAGPSCGAGIGVWITATTRR